MTTINGTISNGIEFGIDYLSPLTVTTSGYINAGTNDHAAAIRLLGLCRSRRGVYSRRAA